MLYGVGSKVVHPCYGAGTIVRIQEKSISDTIHSYYVITTVCRSMQLMVPVNSAQSVGLRRVGDVSRLRNLLSAHDGENKFDPDVRARQEDMRNRLKSGRFEEIVDVVRVLFMMNSRRALGTIDRQLFEQGKELLAGELALALGSDMDLAMQEVEESLKMLMAE